MKLPLNTTLTCMDGLKTVPVNGHRPSLQGLEVAALSNLKFKWKFYIFSIGIKKMEGYQHEIYIINKCF